jgi:hypothetical protein
MTTTSEMNACDKILSVDIVRYFISRNKWIWITTSQSVDGSKKTEGCSIDFEETELANTARMMYFQEGQASYLYRFCDPLRRAPGSKLQNPDLLADTLVDNCNLLGKLKILVERSKQISMQEEHTLFGYSIPSPQALFFVDIFTDNERVSKAILEVLAARSQTQPLIPPAEQEDEIELNYDFLSLRSLKEERKLKSKEEPEVELNEKPKEKLSSKSLLARTKARFQSFSTPPSRKDQLCLEPTPPGFSQRISIKGIDSWNAVGRLGKRMQGSTSDPPADWVCSVDAACPNCFNRFEESRRLKLNYEHRLFAPYCVYGADGIDVAKEWERRSELKYSQWDWRLYPRSALRSQPRPVASPPPNMGATEVDVPSDKDSPVEIGVAKKVHFIEPKKVRFSGLHEEIEGEAVPMPTSAKTAASAALVVRIQHIEPLRAVGKQFLDPVRLAFYMNASEH